MAEGGEHAEKLVENTRSPRGVLDLALTVQRPWVVAGEDVPARRFLDHRRSPREHTRPARRRSGAMPGRLLAAQLGQAGEWRIV